MANCARKFQAGAGGNEENGLSVVVRGLDVGEIVACGAV